MTEMSMSKANRMVDRHFRWRGGEMTRIEAFSDAVFAFALTLLVVALEVPHTFEQLADTMKGFVAFAICFAMLAMVWHVHVKFFRRYGLQTLWVSTLNSILLFVLLFYVYPLKFLFTFLVGIFSGGALSSQQSAPVMGAAENVRTLMVIYGLGFAAVFFLLFLMYRHAWNLRRELELNAMEVHLTKYEMMNQFAMMCFGLVSAIVATLAPTGMVGVAGYLYGGIGIYHFIAGWFMSKRADRILAEQRVASEPPAPAVAPPAATKTTATTKP